MLQIVLTAKDLDRMEEIVKNQEPRFFKATFQDGKELNLVNKHDFDKLSNSLSKIKSYIDDKIFFLNRSKEDFITDDSIVAYCDGQIQTLESILKIMGNFNKDVEKDEKKVNHNIEDNSNKKNNSTNGNKQLIKVIRI